MTIELFVMLMGGLLFICGLFAWYMAFDMYRKFVIAYLAGYELPERIGKALASRTRHISYNPDTSSGGDTDVQTQGTEP